MGTNCAPLVADLFLYCYERDFMDSLNHDNQADVIEAFNSTSRYLDDLLNIDNPYFEGMVNQIYPPELQLNKANISDTEAPFLDLHLSVANGFVSSKIYDKRDDFDFDIVNFPFLDGDVPRRASYGVYISQLIRFARVCNHVTDFNARNKCLTAKLLQQGYRYHKLRKTFSKFYRRHYELISKYNVGLKTLLSEGLSEPEFRHLKQGIQEFHRKYVLVPADKAANNVVVVCRLHYVNTLKQELDGTRAYLETDTDEVSVVNAHLNDLPVKFSVCVNEGQDKLPTMYWLPKLHKRPYKARFIANSSSCTTTELSKLLTFCLTAIKSHVIRYCETVYETSNKNWFWSIKNSGEVLSKLKCRGFRATSLSTYDFSTLYTTLPHNLIKEKLLDLIEWTFKRALKNYGSLYLACNDRKAFFTSSDQSRYTLWSCQNVCDALSYLLDNIYIRFGTKLYRQIVGIPMGTNCAPLVADLFLYCYERDFMDSLNHDNQADVIEAFNSTSRYLDDLLNIDNPYFEGMVNQIYPPELQLNKANISDTEAPFLDLHLSVANGFVSSKIYDKRDDFDFDIVNFPFLDGDVPRRASYGVYISQLIRFARVCNHVTDFNARNKCLTAKLLQQGYRYHKLRKTFSKFYRRHYELISKYNVGLKTLLSEGLSEPEFYGDLVYKLKKLKGITDFSLQFGKIISRYRRIGYNLNVMRQSACLVFNPIMVDNYAAFFNCTPVGRASDSMMAPT